MTVFSRDMGKKLTCPLIAEVELNLHAGSQFEKLRGRTAREITSLSAKAAGDTEKHIAWHTPWQDDRECTGAFEGRAARGKGRPVVADVASSSSAV